MRNTHDIALFPIEGDLDIERVPFVKKELESIINSGCRRIVLCMKGCGYIDSSGVGMLLGIYRSMRAQNGYMSLIDVSEQVYKTLYLSCLVDFIPVSRISQVSFSDLVPQTSGLLSRTLFVQRGCMKQCRDQVRQMLSAEFLSESEIYDLVLAVGEALGNAFDHSGSPCAYVSYTQYADRVFIKVSDDGCGINTDIDVECTSKSLERGRGIKLMHLLCDGVDISNKKTGTGTVVSLIKLMSA